VIRGRTPEEVVLKARSMRRHRGSERQSARRFKRNGRRHIDLRWPLRADNYRSD